MRSVAAVAAPTLDDLQRFVHRTLCQHDALDPEQTPLLRATIRRAGRPCGLFFQVEGPRLLRTQALWAGEEHRLIFYDSAGLKFAEVRLSEAPDPQALAA